MSPLPPLTSLLVLEAFYRSGSVTGAAALLGRTHGAVSKQLHQLQDHAGVALFQKSGSGIELTKPGRIFAAAITDNLSDMRRAYQTLCGGQEDKRVSIKVSSTFARLWAIPTIARFNMDYPDIEIQISLTIAQNSHSEDGPVDLVLSWDRLTSPIKAHPNATTLGDVHIGPVLSPTFHHTIEPGVLSFKTRINRRGSEKAWEQWTALTGVQVRYENEMSFDLAGLAFEAAERGMGVAMAPKFLIEKELRSGTLVAPAGFYCFTEGLVVRPSTERTTPSRNALIFLEWLRAHGRLGEDGFLVSTILEPVWG
ncbi:DNA-binding transcriptional regulator, LysR family [Cohaesibacter sp. ES.047]|uniref:LysR substrate-binding domain-containing protein n=1 Tax=Cohaesibacter sp. ES.047 TaxID=1798205 RepID=UPI000BB8D949|nr:LysR substrate-binding domain-containing protein [Cohaesibacter sp. ES.047]SNY92460.1 DNA-binding transcriptional regulator, LysR family [Cohaesibacter sp. ES.047]